MIKYKVQNYMDDVYKVTELVYQDEYGAQDVHEHIVFQGSISDCEAWIRLHEGGYM